MIRPQRSVDGLAVDIPVDRIVAAVLDALATAYVEDADVVGQLLAEHAEAVATRDHTAYSGLARERTAANADATREELAAELDAEVLHPIRLDPMAAHRLADHLHRLATRTAVTARAAQENAA